MTSLLCTSLRYFPLQVTELIITLLYIFISFSSTAIRIKKPIKTKFRLPVFNWTALKPNQINGTVFNEIDDERVLEVNQAYKTAKTVPENFNNIGYL